MNHCEHASNILKRFCISKESEALMSPKPRPQSNQLNHYLWIWDTGTFGNALGIPLCRQFQESQTHLKILLYLH